MGEMGEKERHGLKGGRVEESGWAIGGRLGKVVEGNGSGAVTRRGYAPTPLEEV